MESDEHTPVHYIYLQQLELPSVINQCCFDSYTLYLADNVMQIAVLMTVRSSEKHRDLYTSSDT